MHWAYKCLFKHFNWPINHRDAGGVRYLLPPVKLLLKMVSSEPWYMAVFAFVGSDWGAFPPWVKVHYRGRVIEVIGGEEDRVRRQPQRITLTPVIKILIIIIIEREREVGGGKADWAKIWYFGNFKISMRKILPHFRAVRSWACLSSASIILILGSSWSHVLSTKLKLSATLFTLALINMTSPSQTQT